MRPVPFDTCLKLIYEFEGDKGQFRPTPAQDPAGNWEIGWGHKLSDPVDRERYRLGIGPGEAKSLACSDLTVAGAAVCTALGTIVDSLTDDQYAALIDFTFNEGQDAFATSTLKRRIMSGDMAGAAAQFPIWKYMHVGGTPVVAEGLVRRRAAELALWGTT